MPTEVDLEQKCPRNVSPIPGGSLGQGMLFGVCGQELGGSAVYQSICTLCFFICFRIYECDHDEGGHDKHLSYSRNFSFLKKMKQSSSNERPNVGGVSIRTSDGAPSRK